jgi:hypothetical protein
VIPSTAWAPVPDSAGPTQLVGDGREAEDIRAAIHAPLMRSGAV